MPHFAVIAGLMLSVTLPGGARASDAADCRFSPCASPQARAAATASYAAYVKHARPLLRLVRLALAGDRPTLAPPTTRRPAPVPRQLTTVWPARDATAQLRAPPPTL